MWQWIIENKLLESPIFEGLGVFVLGGLGWLIKNKANNKNQNNRELDKKTLEYYKNHTKILFIDDDTKFKVVQILKTSGWVHTNTIKDLKTIDCPEVADADIIFVDIQGVGKILSFTEEGLGLASAIKDKYPQKWIVIYSSETQGDRFHKTLKKVDDFLPKNADPYQFQQIVEEWALKNE